MKRQPLLTLKVVVKTLAATFAFNVFFIIGFLFLWSLTPN